jgi:hypothetical protein
MALRSSVRTSHAAAPKIKGPCSRTTHVANARHGPNGIALTLSMARSEARSMAIPHKPSTAASRTTSGSPAHPTKAPEAASNFASPAPRPSRPRSTRCDIATPLKNEYPRTAPIALSLTSAGVSTAVSARPKAMSGRVSTSGSRKCRQSIHARASSIQPAMQSAHSRNGSESTIEAQTATQTADNSTAM